MEISFDDKDLETFQTLLYTSYGLNYNRTQRELERMLTFL